MHTVQRTQKHMKNVTLSADEELLERARQVARSRNSTLNAEFRAWLKQLVQSNDPGEEYLALMKRLRHMDAGRTFSRDELNERR